MSFCNGGIKYYGMKFLGFITSKIVLKIIYYLSIGNTEGMKSFCRDENVVKKFTESLQRTNFKGLL